MLTFNARWVFRALGFACGLGAAGLAGWAQAANIVVDHTNWNWYAGQTTTVTEAVGTQKIFFAHASVGGYIMQGFGDLHGADAVRYPLAQVASGDTPPSTTVNGTLYEYQRGNPGWSAKVTLFVTYLGNGWHAPKVDFAMHKFCYIDQAADWPTYRDSLIALEAAYPATKFVYWTMPLMTSTDSDEVLRNQFNQALRAWIATQDGKLLFDIADIEAWNPSGVRQTFTYNTTSYDRLADEYSLDGGHPNQTGYDRLATGLYSLLGLALTSGTLTPTITATPLAPAPSPTITAVLTNTQAPAGAEITVVPYPNPARKGRMQFQVALQDAGELEIRLYNAAGEYVAELQGRVQPGVNRLAWDCSNVAPGVYLAEVKLNGEEKKKTKIVVIP
jgi:hypothetical protein